MMSQIHVIVLCFCHFWNDNSERLGCFPVLFFLFASFRRPHTDSKTDHAGQEMDSHCRCEEEIDRQFKCGIHYESDIVCTHEVEFVNVLWILRFVSINRYKNMCRYKKEKRRKRKEKRKTEETPLPFQCSEFRIAVQVSSYSLETYEYSSTLWCSKSDQVHSLQLSSHLEIYLLLSREISIQILH